jgi:thiamine pyrophosphokinase
MHVIVILNGALAHPERTLPLFDEADRVVAADGGANWLAQHGISPDVLVGDMDSIAPDLLARLEAGGCCIARHRRDKDETDGELALRQALALGAQRITVLGALGGRADHALANVGLLAMPELADAAVALFDGLSWLFLVRRVGELRGEAGDVVSLLAWGGDALGVSAVGLAYPLRDESLTTGAARGMSNALLDGEAQLTVRQGALLVIHTPRRHLEADHG